MTNDLPEEEDRVHSPCIGVCRIYEASMPRAGQSVGLCAGCFRSADEIAQWPTLSDEQKLVALPMYAARAVHHAATAPKPSSVRAARLAQRTTED